MAALGQTISGVAHELNNPLATILSWAERLAERNVDDKTKQGLEVILGESERAARIVRNLLTFARKRQTTRMMVDLNQVVRETLALRAYEQRVTNIQVIEALAAGLPEVFADGHQIKQVLLNLLINAEQAMPRRQRHAARIVVRTWHDAERGSVVLEVNDDGPGDRGGAAGQGLRSVFHDEGSRQGHRPRAERRLRHRAGARRPHLADVEARARARRSSSSCRSPGSTCNAPAARAAQQPISLEAFKGLRVLVVEDEPALAVAVSEALADAGFVVDRAGDGEEGLTRLTEARYD